jgi:nitrogen fixation/metabolism regulation signal transduction histidine kinase
VELIRKARDGIKETQDKLSETKFNEDATSQVMSDLSAIGTLLDNISENKEEAIEMFNAVRSYFQSVREMMGDYFTSQGSVFRESSYSTMNINKLVGLLGAKIQKAKMIYGQPVEYSSQNDTTLPEQFLDKGRLLNFVLWEIAQEGAEILLERKQCPDFNIRQGEPYVFSVITSREAFQDGQEFSVIHTKDNARGMPPEVARKIEKGERVSHHDIAGRNREQVGGFGMSSAYRIIREHGGFWKVESGQGTGAEFKIYLPIKTER